MRCIAKSTYKEFSALVRVPQSQTRNSYESDAIKCELQPREDVEGGGIFLDQSLSIVKQNRWDPILLLSQSLKFL